MDFQAFLNPNDTTSYSSLDYQGRGLAATKQRKLADMLRQNLKDTPAATPQMVGGQYIRPHWTEGLSDALRTGLAGYAGIKADEADVGVQQAQQGAAEQWRAATPTSVVHDTPMPEGQMGPGQPTVTPPTRETILKHTLEGLTNPLTAKEAAVTNASLTSNLDRTDDKAFRDQQARQSAQERSDNLMAQLTQRADDAQRRSEDRASDRASREAAAKEALALRGQIAQGQQEIARQGLELRRDIANSKGNNEKPLPAAQATAYVNNATALGNIDDALKKVDANPAAFGLTNMLPNAVVTRMDPKGIEARAAVFNLGSLKIHDRSGAAVTASETPRLLPFIPTPGDSAKTIKTKLNGFQREYNLMQQNIEDFAGTQGYKSPRKQSGGGDGTVDYGSLSK
jgi:hypothetical protein